jgi:Barrel-sandwich domain of CusB or HlyD membrane-fusion
MVQNPASEWRSPALRSRGLMLNRLELVGGECGLGRQRPCVRWTRLTGRRGGPSRSASAQVQNAELQLSYTTVYAPTNGRVAQKTSETGQRVQSGQTGLFISEPDDWVVANFKETQLGRIRPSKPIEISVDALPNHKFIGEVDSFQSGTGAVFALVQITQQGISRKSCSGFPSKYFSIEPAFEGTTS